MVMLDVLYSSTPLWFWATASFIPIKTNMQIQRRQVHCGPRVDHRAINLNLASLPEINKIAAIKSASEEGSGVCREVGAGTHLP